MEKAAWDLTAPTAAARSPRTLLLADRSFFRRGLSIIILKWHICKISKSSTKLETAKFSQFDGSLHVNRTKTIWTVSGEESVVIKHPDFSKYADKVSDQDLLLLSGMSSSGLQVWLNIAFCRTQDGANTYLGYTGSNFHLEFNKLALSCNLRLVRLFIVWRKLSPYQTKPWKHCTSVSSALAAGGLHFIWL